MTFLVAPRVVLAAARAAMQSKDLAAAGAIIEAHRDGALYPDRAALAVELAARPGHEAARLASYVLAGPALSPAQAGIAFFQDVHVDAETAMWAFRYGIAHPGQAHADALGLAHPWALHHGMEVFAPEMAALIRRSVEHPATGSIVAERVRARLALGLVEVHTEHVPLDAPDDVEHVATLPAGDYYVGDPCYVLDDDQFDQWVPGLRRSGRHHVGLVDGSTVVGISTAYGDGSYRGSDGFDYDVDSGMLGLVPVAVGGRGEGAAQAGSVRRVTFADPIVCQCVNGGTVALGGLRIETAA